MNETNDTSVENNKKNNYLLWVIGLLLLLGLVFFFFLRTPSATTSDDDALTTAEESSTGGESTFASLFKDGRDVTCTIKNTSQGGMSEGTVYVSGTMMRADFVTKAEGTSIESHMINDGEWMYTWSSASPQGMKMKAPAGSTSGDMPSGMQGQWGDLNQAGAYDCVSWTPSSVTFTPPAGVSFMELGSYGY